MSLWQIVQESLYFLPFFGIFHDNQIWAKDEKILELLTPFLHYLQNPSAIPISSTQSVTMYLLAKGSTRYSLNAIFFHETNSFSNENFTNFFENICCIPHMEPTHNCCVKNVGRTPTGSLNLIINISLCTYHFV